MWTRRRRTWLSLRWQYRRWENELSTSVNHSWTLVSALWSRNLRNRSLECSHSWTLYTTTSGCVSSCRTWLWVSRSSLLAGSVLHSGTSMTLRLDRVSPIHSPSLTVSGSLLAPSCNKAPSIHQGQHHIIKKLVFVCRRVLDCYWCSRRTYPSLYRSLCLRYSNCT